MNTTISTKETEASQAAISSQLNNEQRQQFENLLRRKDSEMKRLQEDTMTKMAVLGKGSMRNKQQVMHLFNLYITGFLWLISVEIVD